MFSFVFIDTDALRNLLRVQLDMQPGLPFKAGQRITQETADFLNAFVGTPVLTNISELQIAAGLSRDDFGDTEVYPNVTVPVPPPVHVHDHNPPAVSGDDVAARLTALGFGAPEATLAGGERRSAVYDGPVAEEEDKDGDWYSKQDN